MAPSRALFAFLTSAMMMMMTSADDVTTTSGSTSSESESSSTSEQAATAVTAGGGKSTTATTTSAGTSGDESAGPTRFCNRTVSYQLKTECQSCALNIERGCPDGLKQITQGPGVADCSYSQRLDSLTVIQLSGCRHVCERTSTVALCCPGYWGYDCNECPGGSSTPCRGHGRCFDGVYGNGSCLCMSGFTGVACEHCQQNMFGPFCNNVCQCIHGTCNDGITGDGSCSCNSGYEGSTCSDSLLTCESVSCASDSRCIMIDGEVMCVCNQGYEQDASGFCQPINRCIAESPPCHQNALCIPTGPDTFDCSCMLGYEGDGFQCSPVDPCQVNFGSCPMDSSTCLYIGPGQSQCTCLEGYENYTESQGCQLVDACALNRSLCHEHASCTVTGPWEVECVCESGYVGDGQNCHGNLLERVKDLHLNDAELKGRFRYAAELMSSTYSDAFTKHGPFTLFLVTDSGFETSASHNELIDIFRDADLARQLTRQHLIASPLTLSDLTNTSMFYMLEGYSAELFYKGTELKFRLDGFSRLAGVIRGNLIAANGIIHVIDHLLDTPQVQPKMIKRPIGTVLMYQFQFETFFKLLKSAGLIDKLNTTGHFTVFVPNNDAWSALTPGTLQYLQSDAGKGKLIAVLDNHIIEGPYLLASDLINTPRFVTLGGVGNTVSVTTLGRITLNDQVNITRVDIPATNGYIHSVDGLLLPEDLLPLLPHRCDITEERTVRGTCGMCDGDLRCPLESDIPLNDTNTGCRYWVNLGIGGSQNYVAFEGCHRMCNRTYRVTRCCNGFYGTSCHPCPGGFQTPCLGQGKCDDGYYGNGKCQCDVNFEGAECEFCSNKQMYGPNCTNKCTCLHGTCDNRWSGSKGQCKPYSCQAGFMGVNCDVQIQRCDKRTRLRCHAFAECVRRDPRDLLLGNVFGRFRTDDIPAFGMNRMRLRNLRRLLVQRSYCRCLEGYKGNGLICVEINRCQDSDRGGCHQQADCIKTGPGQNSCKCTEGWVGDGTYCYPSSPCYNHSHCHQNAICIPSVPNQYICMCEEGYHGNGTYCVLNDICVENNGECDINAACVATGPGAANCTCRAGYIGDGYRCSGSVAYEVHTTSQLTAFDQLLQVIQPEDRYLNDTTSNYTLLAPNNEAVQMVLNFTSPDFWKDDNNVQTLLSYHVIATPLSLNELRLRCEGHKFPTLSDDDSSALTCELHGQEVYLDGAHIVEADLAAVNGYIHIIDKVLEPRSAMVTVTDLQQTLQSHDEFAMFSALIDTRSDFIDDVYNLEMYTMFVPVANSTFPQTASKRYLSYYVVPQLLTMWRLKAMNGKKLNTMLGADLNQQLTVSVIDDKVYINGVVVTDPKDVHTTQGIIHSLGGTLAPVLNRCDTVTDDQQMEQRCCTGYFGINCDECPGGADAPCSQHGVCNDDIDGDGSCECRSDYNGSACENCKFDHCPDDQCQENNGGCDSNQLCHSGPLVSCTCKHGYQEVDDKCVYTAGDCAVANGGCSDRATCTQTDSDTDVTTAVSCSCHSGFVGDGYSCHGSMWMTLSEVPESAPFFKRLRVASNDIQQIVTLLMNSASKVTVFVPYDDSCSKSLTVEELKNYVVNGTSQELTLDVVRNVTTLPTVGHTTLTINISQFSADDEIYFTINGIKAVKANIFTSNGIMHLISTCFAVDSIIKIAASSQAQDDQLFAGDDYSQHVVIAVAVTIGLLLIVILITAAVHWRHALSRQLTTLVSLMRPTLPFHRFKDEEPERTCAAFNVVRFNSVDSGDDDMNPFANFDADNQNLM